MDDPEPQKIMLRIDSKTEKPKDSVCNAVLDAVLFGAGEDGSADRKQLEQTAVRNEAFANVAWHRYLTDHPGDSHLKGGEQSVAIESGLQLLAAEAISWLTEQGHLAESDGRVRLGARQFGSYVPGTDRENDLFYSMRRITPARLEIIRESMRELGDLRAYFPVLQDEDGEVVDGRHRRAIDPDWPAAPMRVPRESRLAAATAANRSSAWTQRDWQQLLQHRQHISGRQEAIHVVVRLALLEDHERSDRKIAGLVGADHKTVASIRKDLEDTGEIPQWHHPQSRGKPPAQPRQRNEALDAEEPGRIMPANEAQAREQAVEAAGGTPTAAQVRAARNGSASGAGPPIPPPAPGGVPGSGEPGRGAAGEQDGGTDSAVAGGSAEQAPEAREHYGVRAFKAAMVVTRLDLDGLLGVLTEDVGPDLIRQELAGFARWAREALGRLGELDGAA